MNIPFKDITICPEPPLDEESYNARLPRLHTNIRSFSDNAETLKRDITASQWAYEKIRKMYEGK